MLTAAWIIRRELGDAHPGLRAREQAGTGPGRRLLYQLNDDDSGLGQNCTPPGIHEFPSDVFTQEARQNGALLLHVFCAMYMFYALAIVCDSCFVPSLEKICKHLHLSEDVAGATFMAAGSSAPELFTSLIGVFIAKSDVGVGTIVGSAVFNILCIIGLCGLFAAHDVALTWWSLFRDSVSYIISVLPLILVIHDEKVYWWEALSLALLYVAYIVVMKYNMRIRCHFEGLRCAGLMRPREEQEGTQQRDSSPNYTATCVVLYSGPEARENSVLMVDELFSASPHKLSFPEASLRIMITRHLRPRTRLSMASRMLINERQRLIRTGARVPDPHVSLSVPGKGAMENGTGANAAAEPRQGAGHPESEETAIPGEIVEGERKEGAERTGPLLPFNIPGQRGEVLRWLFSWPLGFLLSFTVPDCAQPRWEKWFIATFLCSTLWIGLFSYIMVWMGWGIWLSQIPSAVMYLTFCLASELLGCCGPWCWTMARWW